MESQCPAIAPFFGYAGVLAATALSNMGAAYGTAKAGVGILKSGIFSPDLVWKNLIPIIMAGVNGIYGLISAIIILNNISVPSDEDSNVYSLFTGFAHLAAGLTCGLASLASGIAIGVSGDAGVRAFAELDRETKNPRKDFISVGNSPFGSGGQQNHKKKKKAGGPEAIYVSMVLIQVFAGNLALYGLITAIILTQTFYNCE